MAMVLLFLALSVCILFSSSSLWLCCLGEDRILPGNPVAINRTINSSAGTFALGFFSPNKSSASSFYVGIWYNSIPEKAVVWVANRNAHLTDPSGLLAIRADGNLALLDGGGRVLWSTNLTGIPAGGNTSALLLESGNLVLRDSAQRDLWQSFDHPTDTYLPGQQLRLDFRTCGTQNLVSWRDAHDPSPGKFSFGFDTKSPQQVVIKEGSRVRMRGWPWNGEQFNRGNLISQHVAVDKEGISTAYNTTGSLELSRYVLDPSGDLVFLSWDSRKSNWFKYVSMPREPCEFYEPCGAFAYCESEGSSSPRCKCLQGFEPKHMKSWAVADFSGGCVRSLPLAFDEGDAFLRAEAMKLPDNFAIRWNLTEEQCRAECSGSWRCTGYATAKLRGGVSVGSRCLFWFGDLIDLVRVENEGQDLYMRIAASSDHDASAFRRITPSNKKRLIAILASALPAGMVLLVGTYYCILRRRLKITEVSKKRGSKGMVFDGVKLSATIGSQSDISELSSLDIEIIVSATSNFAIENKLGQGGFGSVYKGKLFHVHDVAIKRLSKCSGQGIEEFTNEVKLIAKLQHTNLVRLLGWCSHQEEKMLVYEYMPNGSLDKIIFDPNRSVELDWGRRQRIIEGIANGLLYLHQYSRLKVIHRDLKTSNILLDADKNPKISDFGLARIFGGNQTEANTDRVVGTYGYMSPEYAMDGLFSEKSDVFSFGVMVLEIITGKRTTGFYPYKESLNLLGYVWQLWKDGQGLEVVDSSAGSITSSEAEVTKCIQVGLLCVQEDAADRPSMSSVIFMLRKDSPPLPSPQRPAFALKRNPIND